ncbi:MAG TPA: glucoamylase family protein [Bacteroidales bacterium]|jgi:hypothetical protein|nr:glucoamylase family protein [Bacteroidales bacterium]
MRIIPVLLILLLLLAACRKEKERLADSDIFIDSVTINNHTVSHQGSVDDIDFRKVSIKITFDQPVDTAGFKKARAFFTQGLDTAYKYRFTTDENTIIIEPVSSLRSLTLYRFLLDVGPNMGGFLKEGVAFNFITKLDSTPKFPVISDDSLLTLVQHRTFRYFWDYAHPVSGMARERIGSGDMVTTGGSGFGVMAILTGIERNFISRQQGFERLRKMVEFLGKPSTSRFHGAFPHWMNGSTGKAESFSLKDNGGDLVETAFLIQGLLAVREYFRNGSSAEKAMCSAITRIWHNVEWDWYRNNQNKLFCHWSPEFGWEMNMPVAGWNEGLIAYVLAASSPTHSITKEVYDEGWARNGNYPMRNGELFFNIRLPLGEDYGGPLYFAHYSFLGLDPRNLRDDYAYYLEQNTAHSLINYNYCIDNPLGFRGYGELCWGLTASDIQGGYSASSPLNDMGVIAPTAAISSIPYTPVESMRALRFYYYVLGDRVWGEFGFFDSFNLTSLWFSDTYLAIDEGPIISMIENYRTGLLWNLFMSAPEVRNGLLKLGFTY